MLSYEIIWNSSNMCKWFEYIAVTIQDRVHNKISDFQGSLPLNSSFKFYLEETKKGHFKVSVYWGVYVQMQNQICMPWHEEHNLCRQTLLMSQYRTEVTPFGEEICKIINNDCGREVVEKVKGSEVLPNLVTIFNVSRSKQHIIRA